ncbi:MAG: sulfotransferase [Paracoccaceae bacterium]
MSRSDAASSDAPGAQAGGYGRLERLLHRLALGSRAVAEMSFDIERARTRPDPAVAVEGRHVIVAGLARAGTTALMRRFHASGAFHSLTYRDMPFVLAPSVWRGLSGRDRRDIAAGERAHGDGISVDADSPEGLEEVFWRVFEGRAYIHADHLSPHRPSDETIEAYRAYVAAVLKARDGTREGAARYLAKNNNAILRLPSVAEALPNALIVVPFRAPLAQAASLRRQHRHFTAAQAEDRFTLDYMGWLAHHEFGLGHKPFRFGRPPAAPDADPDGLDYWLGLWVDAYAHLAETAPVTARFVAYERLCEDADHWRALAEAAGIEPEPEGAAPFRTGGGADEERADPTLLARADALYDALDTAARTGEAVGTPDRDPQANAP